MTKATRRRSRAEADRLLRAIKRARVLFDRVVKNGRSVKKPNGDPKPLLHADRRDLAEYLFFEVAAKFEQFAKRALVLEVQKTLGVGRSRAEHMVGKSDDGIPIGMGGWADISRMSKRATGLLGKRAIHAQVETILGNPRAQYLQSAVTLRNRIAHGEGNAGFIAMVKKQPFHLPKNSTKGLSPGKLLLDYPSSAKGEDRWFFRMLAAYEAWALVVSSRV